MSALSSGAAAAAAASAVEGGDRAPSPRGPTVPALQTAERAEMVARARVIARKVWFLRHAALCLEPSKCRLGPCRKAVELVSHMRSCGAMADPRRGCRAPACASAARLVHHPRTCARGAACGVCAMVRAAGAAGKGLVLRKDLCAPCAPSPCASSPRRRAFSSPQIKVSVAPEAPGRLVDDDGFAVPAPRAPLPRKRSSTGSLADASIKAPAPPTPTPAAA